MAWWFFGRRRRGENPQDVLVVRRGASPAFVFFCRMFAKENGLLMVPDRRVNDRRRRQKACPNINRRDHERRSSTSDAWQQEDFCIVRAPRATTSERQDA